MGRHPTSYSVFSIYPVEIKLPFESVRISTNILEDSEFVTLNMVRYHYYINRKAIGSMNFKRRHQHMNSLDAYGCKI